jgi:tRNA modification GTPase
MNMFSETEDTIAAIATPAGRSALGMVRISGKQCDSIIPKIFSPRNHRKIRPFRPTLGKILLESEQILDEAMLTYYKEPHSYTRENLAEITCHGNPRILDRVLETLIHSGARLARPGEFTYRAFLNGRLDLVQAEAVQQLIDADSFYQIELALSQLDGHLSNRFRELSGDLLDLICLMEGNVDFSEEQHYDFISKEEASRRTGELIAQVRVLLGSFEKGKWIREGYHVAFVGKPNVGKSSLFNALLGKDRAIVTSIAGTTRDYLEERITLGNSMVHLFDTAGVRESTEPIEREGVKRSLQVIENANLIVFVVDGSQSLDGGDNLLWKEIQNKPKLLVFNKLDKEGFQERRLDGCEGVSVSATSGAGVSALRHLIAERVEYDIRYSSHDYLISSIRHRDILNRSLERLMKAQVGIEQGLSEELPLLDLHAAMRDLGEITGQVTVDDIYLHIFQNFCIGK